MDQQILQPLTALETSLGALVQSLTTTNTFTGAPHAAADLVKADDALASSLCALKQHQDNHATILRLRAEADTLQSHLRNIVQTCIDFRTRLGNIDPRILEDDNGDEDEHDDVVDYQTLLTLATRIGRYNNVAAYEAEKRAEAMDTEMRQRPITGKSKSATPIRHVNGTTQAPKIESNSLDAPPVDHDKQSEIVRNTIAATNQRANAYRLYTYAPFPIHEHLRWGELGKLQIVRERQGEDIVDAYVENLVRETELGEKVSRSGGSRDVIEQKHDDQQPTPHRRESKVTQALQQQLQPQSSGPQRIPAGKLDVDFPGGDSDSDSEIEDE